MTVHSDYGSESVNALSMGNEELIATGNFTIIMITKEDPADAQISFQCLDENLPSRKC